MAGRISRPTPERPDIADAVARLASLAETQPDLRGATALQAALLRAVYAAPAPVARVSLGKQDTAARLAEGVPLLRGMPLPVDEAGLRETFLRLCAAIRSQSRDALLPQLTALRQSVRGGELDLWELSAALVDGEGSALPERLKERGYPPDLVMTLLRLALLPFLEQVAAQLAPLREKLPWGRGYCPTCGAWPVLAEQRGLEQFRYLRCGLCASSWEVDRVWCLFCGNRDHDKLGYLQVEGEEQKQRAATCDVCHTYVKLRSSLAPLTTPQLLVEEVALLHLDLIAIEKGYAQPA